MEQEMVQVTCACCGKPVITNAKLLKMFRSPRFCNHECLKKWEARGEYIRQQLNQEHGGEE